MVAVCIALQPSRRGARPRCCVSLRQSAVAVAIPSTGVECSWDLHVRVLSINNMSESSLVDLQAGGAPLWRCCITCFVGVLVSSHWVVHHVDSGTLWDRNYVGTHPLSAGPADHLSWHSLTAVQHSCCLRLLRIECLKVQDIWLPCVKHSPVCKCPCCSRHPSSMKLVSGHRLYQQCCACLSAPRLSAIHAPPV